MAVAEARAIWQRTANRCFVQEDAKRAPKLACCQSSPSKQVDAGPAGVAETPDHLVAGFIPINRNLSYSDLPPDTRWWLQLGTNYGYQKGLTCEQLRVLEAEMEALSSGKSPSMVSGAPPSDGRDGIHFTGNKNSEISLDKYYGVSTNCMKKDPKFRKLDLEAVDCKNTQEFLELMDTSENFEFIEVDPEGFPTSKKPNEPWIDPESPWISRGKTEPWWRITDKDDLASLVAQKSLDYMENCDLPPPQKKHTRGYPYVRSLCSDVDKKSSLDSKSRTDHMISKPIVHTKGCLDSGGASVEEQKMLNGFDESLRCSTTHKGIAEIQEGAESVPSKAQLLEALRHSQTRAREAETATKQAYAEKEHILNLFFRQASQLFAYKQWFQMLQLEALYLQIKNSDQPISTLFPVALPWVPYKGRKLRKSWHKVAKGKRLKRARPKHTSKYAVAFALGLGLVGAGLLLGWTVGWMLRSEAV